MYPYKMMRISHIPYLRCVECSFGWIGPDCDKIDCQQHGKPNFDESECKCDKPYTGTLKFDLLIRLC